MYLSITADDAINDVFINGVSYTASATSGPTVRTFEIPADSKVIATNCSDVSGVRYSLCTI